MNVLKASGPVWQAYFSNDGTGAVLVLADGAVEIRNLQSGNPEKSWTPPVKLVAPMALTRTDNLMVAAADGNTIRIHHPGDNALVAQTLPTADRAGRITIAPNGKFFAVAYTEERVVRLFETASGKLLAKVPGGVGGNSFLGISPDHRYLFVASYDASCCVFNLSSHQMVHSYEDLPMALFCGAFAADSQSLYAGSADGKLYRFAHGVPQGSVLASGLKCNLNQLAFVNATTLASTESDPASNRLPTQLRLWENGKPRTLGELPRTPSSLDSHQNRLIVADGTPEVRWLALG